MPPAIQLEAILGAFAAGLILAETSKRKELEEQISPIADMLVPVFFVTVGARTDISVLNPLEPANRAGLVIASFLVVVAIIGKIVTGFAIFGQPGVNKLAVGIGMIPRGEVGLVFAGGGGCQRRAIRISGCSHYCYGDSHHISGSSLTSCCLSG